MVARDASFGEAAQLVFTEEAKRGAQTDAAVAPEVAHAVAEGVDFAVGGAPAARDEREAPDALFLVLPGMEQAFFGRDEGIFGSPRVVAG